MKKQGYLIKNLTAFLLMLQACEMSTDWDLKKAGDFLVADCIITNEAKVQELTLTTSLNELNGTPAGISGAQITLSDGVTSFDFAGDPIRPGKYLSVVPFGASLGKTYRLTVKYGSITDTAYAEMVAITPLETMVIAPVNDLYRFVYKDSPRPSMTEVFYNWSSDSAYSESYGAGTASEVHYTLDNIDAGKIFAPERMIIPFPLQTEIIRRKYSLSEPHQDFLRSLLLETEWRGGLFDVEQGNVPTNFHHGIRGWFAACMVLSDTTVIF
jgi:hypothetical protein